MAQIKVNDLTFCYEGSYDNIFEHVNLQIDTDWRCGLIGRNGKGKTTAALGQAIKEASKGKTVIIVQFLKGKQPEAISFIQR